MHKEIRGKRVILREQRPEDAGFFAYWFNRPEIMFQCGFTEPTDEAQERVRILRDHRSEDSVWFTVTDPDGRILGETGLLRMFPAWHQTDLTIILPDPATQRKGCGTEAITLLLDLAFGEYDMHRVSIGVVGQNRKALAFYRRIGFRQEGILEDGYFYHNEYSDFIMLRILRPEWEARSADGGAGRGREAAPVELVEVDESNFGAICALRVREDQRGFLDSVVGILARGYVYRDRRARVFAIASEGTPVGVLLVKDMDEEPACYDLQQFMVDARSQGRGLGTAALRKLLAMLAQERKYDCVEVCVKSTDAPALHVYEKVGFTDTGYIDEDAPDSVNLMFRF